MSAMRARAQRVLENTMKLEIHRMNLFKHGEDHDEDDVEKVMEQDHSSNTALLVYIFFMMSFCIASYLDRGDATRYYTGAMIKEDLLTTTWRQMDTMAETNTSKTFHDIANVGETYMFIQKVALPFFLQETADNGEPIPIEKLYYPHNNKLLGIRLRTIRVKPDECYSYMGTTSNLDKTCYAEWSDSVEEREPYGNGYTWDNDDENLEHTYWGRMGFYAGSGYYMDLPLNLSVAQDVVKGLRSNAWIDDAVRSVFFDVQMYNVPHNLHVIVRMVVEYPHTGGTFPICTITVMKVNRYFGVWGRVQLAFEFIILFFTIYYLIQEIQEIRSLGCRTYSRRFYNVLDLINIFIFISVGIMRTVNYFKYRAIDPVLSEDFESLQQVVNAFVIESALLSMNAFLLWLKILKYLRRYGKIAFLTRTFIKAGQELFFFVVMFACLLFGFGHGGFIAFSETSVQFRSFSISLISTFSAATTGLDGDDLEEHNVIAGPLFTFVFELLITMILINVFLAIINTAYEQIALEDKMDRTNMIKGLKVNQSMFEWLKSLFDCRKKNKVNPTKEPRKTERFETEEVVLASGSFRRIKTKKLQSSGGLLKAMLNETIETSEISNGMLGI